MLKFLNLNFFQTFFLENFQDKLKFKMSQVLRENKKFLKGSKVTSSKPKVKILHPNVKPSLRGYQCNASFFYAGENRLQVNEEFLWNVNFEGLKSENKNIEILIFKEMCFEGHKIVE